MSWVINSLGNLIWPIIQVGLHVFAFFSDALVGGIVYLVLKLLDGTVFAPFTFASNHTVGDVANIVWATFQIVSAGIALVQLTWGIATRLALRSVGGRQSWAELGEGLAVWAAVMIGGWAFLNLLIGVSNMGTHALIGSMQQAVNTALGPIHGKVATAAGLAGYAAAVLTYLLWPLSGIVLAGLLVWVVGVWLMRQVDLVLYAGLLPVTAALGISGNKAPFKWAWSEAMGAVFSQLAMAVILWIGFLFLSTMPPHGNLLTEFKNLMLAASVFTLAAQSPKLLAQITGHQYASSGHLLASMAGGYLAGRGVEAAVRRSRLGQAMRAIQEGGEARSAKEVAAWGGLASVGQGWGGAAARTLSGWTQRLGGAAKAGIRGAVGAMPGGGKLLAAADRAQSAVTAAGSAVAGAVAKPVTAARDKAAQFAADHPWAQDVGAAAGRVGRSASNAVRTAGSLLYQPRSTLGRLVAEGTADSHPEGSMGVFERQQAAAVHAAQFGIEDTLARFGSPEWNTADAANRADAMDRVGRLLSARITEDPATGKPTIEWHRGAWQKQVYDAVKNGMTREFNPTPVTTVPREDRHYV